MEHAEKKIESPPASSSSTRNLRGSLEVFNPSTYNRTSNYQVFRPQSSWKNWADKNTESPENISGRHNDASDKVTSWMALKESTPPQSLVINEGLKSPAGSGSVAQRAAEWGLVLKTDDETGKLKGVKVRNSGGDDPSNNKAGTPSSRKNSSTSIRSSGDLSDDGGKQIAVGKITKSLYTQCQIFCIR